MDTVGLIAIVFAIVTGLMLGYYFSPRGKTASPERTK